MGWLSVSGWRGAGSPGRDGDGEDGGPRVSLAPVGAETEGSWSGCVDGDLALRGG